MTDRHVRVQQNPFAQVPEALGYDPSITDGAFRVYFALLRHGTDPTNCYPSHARLGRLIGKSPRSINRLVVELEEAGWITRVPRHDSNGARTSDGYYVRQTAPAPGAPPPAHDCEEGAQDDDDVPSAQNREEGAQEGATPAHEGAKAPRMRARRPRASAREEREPSNESHGTTPPTPPQAGGEDDPGGQLVLVNPPAGPTAEQTFDVFWQRFPGRHGGPPIRKEKARERWAKLDLATQRAAAKGAAAYARFCEEQDRYPKDPDRWLRDRMWVDFLDERASTPAAHRPTGPAVREPVPVELTDVDALPHRAVDLADPEVVARQAAEARKRLGRAG